jgi:predicted ATPase/class 3 adenylate cyclase
MILAEAGSTARRWQTYATCAAHLRKVGEVLATQTLTFLFTDIEGSTAMLARLGQSYAEVLADHHQLIRACLAVHEGQEIDTQGDAFFAVFTSPSGCAAAAVEMQRALAAHSWPAGEAVRVRMGIHCGEASVTAAGPVGLDVHRAARIAAVGHGGQIVVSAATAAMLRDSLPADAAFKDLGLHRLKDLGRPEQLFQLQAGGLPTVFPPLRSLDNPELPNNLPRLLSAFVGRVRELGEVRALIGSSRLVTLTGAGGSGKTRLALQAAAELLDGTGQGVWLVELAALTDPGQLPAAVAGVLGIRAGAGASVLDSLIDALSDQRVLLVLDNCEHLISGAAALAGQICRDCPAVHLLATSREPLGIDGEHVYRVPPLSLPPHDAETVADLDASDAVALFAERATEHDSGFGLQDTTAGLVASVCWRLDGIPLALELAAARLATMSLEHVVGRLDHRFRLLTGGSRSALPRQQTLRAMIDWSHDLLDEPERAVLRLLSVFAGGFELDAAEAICAGVGDVEVADVVGSLVNKSLVVAERSGGSLRYRLLETIRQYALEQLVQAGAQEVRRARDAHAGFYLELAETAGPQLTGSGQIPWFNRLDLEWDNLKAAMAHLFAQPDLTEAVLRLGTALLIFAIGRGHYDAVPYLRSALERPGTVPGRLRVLALLSAGWQEIIIRGEGGDRDAVRSAAKVGGQALELARELGDDWAEAAALAILSDVAAFEGDRSRALLIAEQSVTAAHRARDAWIIGVASFFLAGWLAAGSGDLVPADLARSSQLCIEALDHFRQLGDLFMGGTVLAALARTETRQGHLDAARAHYQEALAAHVRTGFTFGLPGDQLYLGRILLLQGDPREAALLFHPALLKFRQRGDRLGVVWAIWGLSYGLGTADADRAAQLHGAVDALAGDAAWAARWRIGLSQAEQRLQEARRAELREFLGQAEFDRAYRLGAALSYEQAADLALGRADPT